MNTKEYNEKIVELFDKDKLEFHLTTSTESLKNIKIHQGFYDLSIFPNLSNINTNIIKEELNSIINKEWKDWPEHDLWKRPNFSTSWKVIPLMTFGEWSKFSDYFPKTKGLFQNFEVINIGFSKLGPKTKLKLHKGWGNLSNNILRCHLGIDVPEECYLYVMDPYGNHYQKQENNKMIIFDDSLYHSANNNSNKDRIVMIIDLKRPEYLHKGISDVEDTTELTNFVKELL